MNKEFMEEELKQHMESQYVADEAAESTLTHCNVNYIDFEKVIFGLQQFLRYFELGKRCRVIANFDPKERSINIDFFEPDVNGKMKLKSYGHVVREDCERFIMFIGRKYIEDFEPGREQRITIDYDPQNEKASIGIQLDTEMHSAGSSGINEESVSGRSHITSY